MKAKVFSNVLFFGVACSLGVDLGMKPWPVCEEQRQQADQYITDAAKAESKRFDLERQRAKYESPLGQEELAREKGYLKNGESELHTGG